jgi:type I restriction enzyme S subunit
MSLPRYPNYKDSGVPWMGRVPQHWIISQSRRLFGLRNERAVAGDKQLTASQQHGVIYQDEFIRLEGRRVVEVIKGADILKHVEPNDFVISMRSFQGGIEWCRQGGCISSAYVMLVPGARVHAPFFVYLLKSKSYIQALQATTNLVRDGQALRYDNFAQVPLPVVPMAEQNAIAAFLDHETAKIDNLVAEQERLIELLKEKRQAVISHAVTKGLNPDVRMKDSGVEWLGDVPGHWAVVGLTKYLNSVVDYRGRTPTKVDDGVFLVTARNVGEGRIDYAAAEEFIAASEYERVMSRGKPEVGDVLFTTEAPLGHVANVDRTDVALAQRIIKFRGDPAWLNNYFLKYWLMSGFCQADMVRLATGSTALGIKGSKVGQLRLCLPPVPEQVAIAEHLDSSLAKLDALTVEAQRGIDLLQERRTALMSAAVTGQIDVREVAGRAA